MDQLTFLIMVLGVAFALLTAITMLASRERESASRPFRRDPMDWHPGRAFPPVLMPAGREDKHRLRTDGRSRNPGRQD
jgi:hypothetical protein